jgi:hypothetical protein
MENSSIYDHIYLMTMVVNNFTLRPAAGIYRRDLELP